MNKLFSSQRYQKTKNMLINAFLRKIHDSHPIGKKLPSCWCTLYRVGKKIRLVEPQATNGTSGNKLIAL